MIFRSLDDISMKKNNWIAQNALTGLYFNTLPCAIVVLSTLNTKLEYGCASKCSFFSKAIGLVSVMTHLEVSILLIWFRLMGFPVALCISRIVVIYPIIVYEWICRAISLDVERSTNAGKRKVVSSTSIHAETAGKFSGLLRIQPGIL
jgi:hypothetical protein